MAGPRSFDARFEVALKEERAAQGLGAPEILTPDRLADLPTPVARYVRASGAVGRPIPRVMRVECDAVMHRKPGDAGIASRSVQVNWFGNPSRLFLMRARMFGLPVRALHLYRREQATFQVRIASLVDMVDQAGDEISAAETVTVLNDLVILAPGVLADPRLSWRPIDDRSAAVIFTNGRRVSATLVFNDRNELVDFWSDDRPDSSSGRFVPMRWHTPIGRYRETDGLRLPTWGTAAYDRPDGLFTYGEFTIRSIAYDEEALAGLPG